MSDIPPPTVPPSIPPPPGGSYTPPPGGSYPPPLPPSGGSSSGSDRTLMLVLSYLWILCLIPLLTKKDDPEVQWHAKNGTALLGVEVVVWIAFMIIGYAFSNSMMGCGLATIQCVVWLAFLVLHILAIVKAVGGGRMRIPVVSDFADKM